MIDALFGVKDETRYLVEIMDVQDELIMVKSVLTAQKDVLDHLAKLYPKAQSDDDEQQPKNDQWAALKRLLPLLSGHVNGVQAQSQTQLTEPGMANFDAPAVENLNAKEGGAQLQAKIGGADGAEIKDGDLIDIEEEAREHGGARGNGEAKGNIPGGLNQSSLTETLVNESQSQLSATETPVLKTRSLLEEAIDLVDANIKSVDHMLQHASKVQEEVQTQRWCW